MKLPAFFGHQRSINLLPRDSFETSILGVILEWALVFGKWAVIVTQLVVMGAFLWRFSLDRRLADLRKSIASDVAIVKSYDQVERDFVLAQKQITQAKLSMTEEQQILKMVDEIGKITPDEVWYEKISISPNSAAVSAYAASLNGFGQFLTTIQADPTYSGVRVGKIESSTVKGAELQFDVAMDAAGGIKK
jgi:Tfp pilus assembly protein PilN